MRSVISDFTISLTRTSIYLRRRGRCLVSELELSGKCLSLVFSSPAFPVKICDIRVLSRTFSNPRSGRRVKVSTSVLSFQFGMHSMLKEVSGVRVEFRLLHRLRRRIADFRRGRDFFRLVHNSASCQCHLDLPCFGAFRRRFHRICMSLKAEYKTCLFFGRDQ